MAMTTPAAIASLKVLLVDDHPVVRAGYRRLLELDPAIAVVGEHSSADAALEALATTPESQRPNVVVVDLAMPGRSGLELLREVRERYPAVRVLVFSMHDNASIVAEALRVGAAGFVTKGSAPEELVHAVRHVTARHAPVLSTDLAQRHVLQVEAEREPLTLKEIEVLRMLAAGEPLQRIAEALQLSPKTVSNYQTTLKHKLGATTSMDLLRHARQRGIVT